MWYSREEFEGAVQRLLGIAQRNKEAEPEEVVRWFCSFCTMEWKGDLNGPCSYCKKDHSCAVSFPHNKPVTDLDRKRYARSINRAL